MPFDMHLKAKATGDGSCGLYCFVPTVVKNLQTKLDEHKVANQCLVNTFQDHYQITQFNADKLTHLLKDLNPREKEALLGPVLRKMLVNAYQAHPGWSVGASKEELKKYLERMSEPNYHLHAGELNHLAQALAINFESYERGDDKEPSLRDVTHALSAHVLKIRNEKNHWEFEMNMGKTVDENRKLVKEHNAHYEDRLRYFNANTLQSRLKAALKRGDHSLKNVFSAPDVVSQRFDNVSENKDKSNFGRISAMIDTFVKSMTGGSSGPGKKEDMFTGLFKIFANIFKAILGIMDLGTQIGKMNNHETSPEKLDLLSEADRAETINFEGNTKLLASAGGSAQLLANNLNKEWNKNLEAGNIENKDTLWLKLIEALKRQGKTGEALDLLKQCEEALLQKLNQAGDGSAPQVPTKSGGDVAYPAQVHAGRVAAVLDQVNSLANVIELAQAPQSKQKACLEVRVDLYKRAEKAVRTKNYAAITPMFNNFNNQFEKVIKDCAELRMAKEKSRLG